MFQLVTLVFIFSFIFNSLIVMTSAFCGMFSHTCPNGILIEYPFWYQAGNIRNTSEIRYCGYPGLEIKCGDNDGRAYMNISDHLYYVLKVDYNRGVLRLVDTDVEGQDCPRPKRNVSLESAPSLYPLPGRWYILYNCSNYIDDKNVDPMPCLDNYYYNSTTVRLHSYVRFTNGQDTPVPNWSENCEETVTTPMPFDVNINSLNYTKSARFGFDLDWLVENVPRDCWKCEKSGGRCYHDNTTLVSRCYCYAGDHIVESFCPHGLTTGLKAIIGVSTGVVGLLLILLLIYRKTFYTLVYSAISPWKKKIKKPTNVEEFLESYGVALHRYSYSEIKKMTNSFKVTLGQGGYGSVFQGKLNRDGLLVVVKVLNESKGNGEDFINEVATIGRTNHVNVVSLLGFCIEGTKRALVYEFMPNGSLERFIYNDKMSSPSATILGWDRLYQIALGIARGLEYLHCRCNTRIVHFDIKPHNILLDQGFCPKISDFGLAKLCKTKESIVSMVGARGTMGYIAL